MDIGKTSQAVVAQQQFQGPPRKVKDGVARVTIPVTGMTCAHCAQRIAHALLKLPGVQKASVNHTAAGTDVRAQAGRLEALSLPRSISQRRTLTLVRAGAIIMARKVRVGSNSYRVIGKRAADAVALQDDRQLAGVADDPAIRTLRAQQARHFLATLILSQGVSMLSPRGDHGTRTAPVYAGVRARLSLCVEPEASTMESEQEGNSVGDASYIGGALWT